MVHPAIEFTPLLIHDRTREGRGSAKIIEGIHCRVRTDVQGSDLSPFH